VNRRESSECEQYRRTAWFFSARFLVPLADADGKVRAFPIAGCGNPTCSAPSTSSAVGAAISSQPVVAGGVVYVGTANGKLVAFNTAGVSLYSTTVDATASRVFVVEDGASVYVTTNAGIVAAYRLP
jgi:outer membrane protein assembly factor BamB